MLSEAAHEEIAQSLLRITPQRVWLGWHDTELSFVACYMKAGFLEQKWGFVDSGVFDRFRQLPQHAARRPLPAGSPSAACIIGATSESERRG